MSPLFPFSQRVASGFGFAMAPSSSPSGHINLFPFGGMITGNDAFGRVDLDSQAAGWVTAFALGETSQVPLNSRFTLVVGKFYQPVPVETKSGRYSP